MLTPQDLYFLLHTGNPGDVEFYVAQVQGAHSVLEVGCGDGRILQHLLARDRQVVGLDVEDAFVQRARRIETPSGSSLRIDCGDVRFSKLPRAEYDRILIPYNTIYALGGASGVKACASNCFDAATLGATLWLDVYPVDEFHEMALTELPPEDDDEPIVELEGPRGRYSVTETTQLHPLTQHLEASYRAISQEQDLVELTLHHDYLLHDELVQCFESEGWTLVFQGHGFHAERRQLESKAGLSSSASWSALAREDGDCGEEEEAEDEQLIFGFCKTGNLDSART